MNYELLVKLICAHLISDFLFQNKWMCEQKKCLKTINGWMVQVLHTLIHSLMAYLLVAQWTCWLIPLIIFVSHFVIDVCKAVIGKDGMWTFIFDQVAHLVVILFLFYLYVGHTFNFLQIPDNLWILMVAYILILKPSSIFIEMFYKRWINKSTISQKDNKQQKSLPNAGKYIGYLERILIVTFMLCGSLEGIGFLLAAKSVFRFGDLQKSEDVQSTEYVLIGTFLSFAIAVIIGLMAKIIL